MKKIVWNLEHYGEAVAREIELAHYDPTIAPDLLAGACMNRADIDLAAEEATEFAYHWDEAIPAVYVMGERGAPTCKIGVSSNPLIRAQQRGQSGPPICIWALFWMVEGKAFALEALSLALAGKIDRRKAGEWVEMSPETAAFTIASAALKVGVAVADSCMHLSNMAVLRDADKDARESIVIEKFGRQHLAFLRMNERLGVAPT